MNELATGRGVVAIGAHPDDIELGCGGTLLRHCAAGDPVTLVVLSTGARTTEQSANRRDEQERASKLLGATGLVWGGYEGGRIPTGPDIVELIEAAISEAQATVVYVPTLSDDHQEHVKAAQASLAAARRVPTVLCYEGPSSQRFVPTTFVDISTVLDKKIELVSCHRSQSTGHGTDAETIRSRAQFRGVQGLVPSAEGFEVHRLLWSPGVLS
jgi:LmbE family N-acetylglucosaminyl deacetylase